ncbi:MAG: Carbohydrate acetyl esterase/feruloyl esterase precursor, partial [Pseudomonadota bacterium]
MHARRHLLSVSFFTLLCALPAHAQREPGRCKAQLPANAEYREVLSVHMGNVNWPFIVLLPDGYSPADAVRYPVIYLLHGNTDDECIGPERSHIERVAAAGAGYPKFIYVFVNGGPTCRYTDNHVNCPSQKSESYIIKELIPHIDANYKTVANRGGRALDGFSMGGEGAAKFGYKYSDMFCSFVAYSGHGAPPELTENMEKVLANKLQTRFVVGGAEGERVATVQSHYDAVKAAGIPTSLEIVPGIAHSLPDLYDGAYGAAGIKTHFDCFASAANDVPPENTGGSGGVEVGGAQNGGATAGGAPAGGAPASSGGSAST